MGNDIALCVAVVKDKFQDSETQKLNELTIMEPMAFSREQFMQVKKERSRCEVAGYPIQILDDGEYVDA